MGHSVANGIREGGFAVIPCTGSRSGNQIAVVNKLNMSLTPNCGRPNVSLACLCAVYVACSLVLRIEAEGM